MIYNIGDIIKVKCYMTDSATIYHSRIAAITEICKSRDPLSPFHYEVIISGIEERKYFVNEDDILEKIQ
ncbi:MAG: hypothetical protein EBR30_24060 [Cytophagia bacterium]|nr:hypothetical protein [Cytophagia bacterium]